MTNIQSASLRAVIMDLLKTKFGVFSFWEEIEPEIAIFCSELPDVTTDETREDVINKLTEIKTFIIARGVVPEELKFLDEEIERFSETKQISVYVDKEDRLDDLIVDKYSRLSAGTEGVMGIHLPLNYNQLKKLTNGVFKKTKLVKFYISRETTVYGKIVAEMYEFPQKIPVATLIQSKKTDNETGDPKETRVVLFGEKYSAKEYSRIKEVEVPFYVYRFITTDSKEFFLLTTEAYEIGDYIVTGVMLQIDDLKQLTDSAKLPTKLPYMFAQQVRSHVIKFDNNEEFFNRVKLLNIDKDFFIYPFTVFIKKRGKTYKLNHPVWFEWLIWAWLTHSRIGMINMYPMHIIILGPPGAGKSVLLNSLHSKSKECSDVFSGSSSTMKHLVPSFKYNPAKIGYLAESNRFAFLDEFFRCMMRTKTATDGSPREESVAMMNDLLEHQKRVAGSGVSNVRVNMTARIIATTNLVRDIHTMDDLLITYDESFLTRWLIYFQSSGHSNMILTSSDSKLEEYNDKMDVNEWVSILDYLHSFNADYDMERVIKIYDSVLPLLSETLRRHYESRHKHHIECIIDGIIKTRCLLEHDDTFKAKEGDYLILEEIWKNVIKSWIKPEYIRKLELKDRIFYLPERCQLIYWKISKDMRPWDAEKLRKHFQDTEKMTTSDFHAAVEILVGMDLLVRDKLDLITYWMANDEKQTRLSDTRKDDEVVSRD